MAKLLLLYDTMETDFARDVEAFLRELALDVVMIPLSPDMGKTLQDKEKLYFAQGVGAVFLITPGSERNRKTYPSPSVCDEMGQAKVYYSKYPERVNYLVDSTVSIQVIDQKCYITFERGNIRSVIAAFTQLIRNLKAARLIVTRSTVPLGSKPPSLGNTTPPVGPISVEPKEPAFRNALTRGLLDLEPKEPAFRRIMTRGLLDIEPNEPAFRKTVTRGLLDLEPNEPALKEGLSALEKPRRAIDPGLLDKLKKEK